MSEEERKIALLEAEEAKLVRELRGVRGEIEKKKRKLEGEEPNV